MTTATRYPIASIMPHRAMFLLIAAVYPAIELCELFPKGSNNR